MKQYTGKVGYVLKFCIVAQNKKEAKESMIDGFEELSPIEPKVVIEKIESLKRNKKIKKRGV